MTWFFGIFSVLAGLLGAFLVSGSLDTGMTTFGLGLIVFAVVFIFWLMKDHYDQNERSRS